MPLLDPSTVPATSVHTDLRPLADLVPCDQPDPTSTEENR